MAGSYILSMVKLAVDTSVNVANVVDAAAAVIVILPSASLAVVIPVPPIICTVSPLLISL